MIVIGRKINKFLLLSRILESELKRQDLIYQILETKIHNDLKNIVGDYESNILWELKTDVISEWNQFRETMPHEEKSKMNIDDVILNLKKYLDDIGNFKNSADSTKNTDQIELIEQTFVDQITDSLDFLMCIYPMVKKETIQKYILNYKVGCTIITGDDYHIVGFSIEEFMKDIKSIALTTLDGVSQKIQEKLSNIGILLKDENFILYRLEKDF